MEVGPLLVKVCTFDQFVLTAPLADVAETATATKLDTVAVATRAALIF